MQKSGFEGIGVLTAVIVSMHRTKGSDVRYLESAREYSFHSCPNRSCAGAIRVWLKAKYPSKKKWIVPAT